MRRMSGAFTFYAKRNGIRAKKPGDAVSTGVRQLSYMEQRRVNALAARGLAEVMSRTKDAMFRKHGARWPGGTGMSSLSRRSGRGLAGFTRGTIGLRSNALTATFSVPRYLGYQEFGVVSTAKGKFLAIPLPAALKPDGTPKKANPRQWKNTFVVEGRRSDWVICTKQGRNIVPLYVLKKTVRIRPRLGLRSTMKGELRQFNRDLTKRLRDLWQDKK